VPELAFIPDRHICSDEDDRLRHDAVADELARIVRSVEPPTNVALYGAWGSGKSGVAELLRVRVDRRDGARCVKFDAAKYAENPLRRHAISQIAESLGFKDQRFTKDLYSERTTTRYQIPRAHALKLFVWFIAALVAISLVATGLIWAVAAVSDGDTSKNFTKMWGNGARLALGPAALLGAIIALSNQVLPVKRTARAPDSDEEFERLFRRLVAKSNAKPLVIVIDELDRCAPDKVVSVLETVRTFMGVAPCVFVVAADQTVLERALREQLPQATPGRVANPFYSAGSEYLDKVFQYQITIPPPLPRRLSGYALELAADMPGWVELPLDELIYALVPIHVRSPRRVKTLLNAYASAYSLASARHAAGALAAAPIQRAAELAKLVCLRHEFPLFAADLVAEPRLPELMLKLATGVDPTDPPEGVRASSWEMAVEYSGGRRPVDVNLADDEPEPIAAAQAQALISYLQATSHIPGPGRDLIFLESGGDVFGLEPGVAEQLEELAVLGQSDSATSLIEELTDAEARQAALRMLAARWREPNTAVERVRLITVLALEANTMARSAELGPVAAELAEVLERVASAEGLREEQLAGAWCLALEAGTEAGVRLQEAVLKDGESTADHTWSARVIADAALLTPTLRGLLGGWLDQLIHNDVAAAGDAVVRIGNEQAQQDVIVAVARGWSRQFRALGVGALDPEQQEQVDALARVVRQLSESLHHHGAGRASAEIAIALLGQVAVKGAREAVHREAAALLNTIAPVDDAKLARAVITFAFHLPVEDQARWLGHIEPATMTHVEEAATLLLELIEDDWLRYSKSDLTGVVLADAVRGIAAAKGDLSWPRTSNVEIEVPPAAPGDSAYEQSRAAVEAMADVDLLGRSEVADALLRSLAEAMIVPTVVTTVHSELVRDLVESVATSASLDGLIELDVALSASAWTSPPIRERLRLLVEALLIAAGADLDRTSAEDVRDLHTADPSAAEAVGWWVAAAQPSPDDLWTILEGLERPPRALLDGVQSALADISPDEIVDYVVPMFGAAAIDRDLLRAIGWRRGQPDRAAGALIEAYGNARNNAERNRVLDLWVELRPSSRSARRRLLIEVLIPMARANGQALDHVLSNIDLVRDPPGVKTEVRQALLAAGQSYGRDARVRRALTGIGWLRERKRLLRSSRYEVVEGEDRDRRDGD
jgi:hypothetical protein